jgi:hypothetical protein
MLSAFSSRLLPRGFQLISCDFLRQAIRERVFYSVGSEQMDDSDYTFRAATDRWPAFRNIARSLSPTQRLGMLRLKLDGARLDKLPSLGNFYANMIRWKSSAESLRRSRRTRCTCSARVVLVTAAKAARSALQSRSALAAFSVNNSAELFKPPETTRSNHRRAFNPAIKQLTLTKN